jgi:apolipoprotein N-acyltransferase
VSTRRAQSVVTALPRLAVAAGGGAALAAAFPPVGAAWLAPFAIAAVTLSAYRCTVMTGALSGLAAGLAFFLPLLSWLRSVGDDAWIAVGLAQALAVAALGAGCAIVTRRRGWVVGVAGLWVLQEAVRGRWPFGGLPWGRVAFSQSDTPAALLAPIGGAPLVTFVVAVAGQSVALGVLFALGQIPVRPAPGSLLRRAGATLVAVPLVTAAAPGPGQAVGQAQVALVQGHVPELGLDGLDDAEGILRRHAAGTAKLALDVAEGDAAPPDFVVWPENAANLDPTRVPVARHLVTEAVDQIDAPVMLGALLDGGGEKRHNTTLVWNPKTGPGEFYVKRHPVPFSEYLPMRRYLVNLDERFALIGKDYARGAVPGTLSVDGLEVGDIICYEIGYDAYARDVVRRGARVLVMHTNSSMFTSPAQSDQQLAMARIRAMEHRRSVVLASLGGISALIGPDGRVLMSSDVNDEGYLAAPLPLMTTSTPSAWVGVAPEWILAGAGVMALAAGLPRRPVPFMSGPAA